MLIGIIPVGRLSPNFTPADSFRIRVEQEVVLVEAMPCFAPKAKPTGPQAKQTDEDLLRTVVDDLIRRKTSKPRTPRTLLSTIHARCGKNLVANRIEGIYAALVRKGFVKVDGAKVSYSLPTEPLDSRER